MTLDTQTADTSDATPNETQGAGNQSADTGVKSSLLGTGDSGTPDTNQSGSGSGEPAQEQADATPAFYDQLPENWRDQVALQIVDDPNNSDDVEKAKRQLQRFSTFKDFARWGPHAQKKISEGISKSDALPEDATEEQVKEWRQAKGIPESADKYDLGLDPESMSETDVDMMKALSEVAHKHNVSNDVLKDLSDGLFQKRAAAIQARQDQDGIEDQQTEQSLRQNWGADYERNVNVFKAALGGMSENLRNAVSNSRSADGRALLNNPEFVSYFVNLQREANPTVALVPSDGTGSGATLDSEIAQIKELIQNDDDKYWKDQSMQDRYRMLLEAKSKIKN